MIDSEEEFFRGLVEGVKRETGERFELYVEMYTGGGSCLVVSDKMIFGQVKHYIYIDECVGGFSLMFICSVGGWKREQVFDGSGGDPVEFVVSCLEAST